MEFTVSELSKYLGVAPNTIERWVKQGRLPVFRKDKNYQFQLDELKKWAFKHDISLNLSDKRARKNQTESMVLLSDAIRNGGIFFDIQGNDVNSVLSAALDRIPDILPDFKNDILERLIEREQAHSTGIGNGIAIPHPREEVAFLKEPVMAMCFLKDPVEYHALDQKPVSILFVSLCPSLKIHLHLLSSLSYCLRDSQFQTFIHSKPDPDLIIENIEILQAQNPMN